MTPSKPPLRPFDLTPTALGPLSSALTPIRQRSSIKLPPLPSPPPTAPPATDPAAQELSPPAPADQSDSASLLRSWREEAENEGERDGAKPSPSRDVSALSALSFQAEDSATLTEIDSCIRQANQRLRLPPPDALATAKSLVLSPFPAVSFPAANRSQETIRLSPASPPRSLESSQEQRQLVGQVRSALSAVQLQWDDLAEQVGRSMDGLAQKLRAIDGRLDGLRDAQQHRVVSREESCPTELDDRSELAGPGEQAEKSLSLLSEIEAESSRSLPAALALVPGDSSPELSEALRLVRSDNETLRRQLADFLQDK